MDGGVGTGSAVGNAPSSPAFPIASYGIEAGSIYLARLFIPDFASIGLTANIDYFDQSYSGSTVWAGQTVTFGNGSIEFGNGDSLESEYDLTGIQVSLDWDWTKTVAGGDFGYSYGVSYGPRVQYFNYAEKLKVTNTEPGNQRSGEENVNFGQYGLGMFGEVNVGKLLGRAVPGKTAVKSALAYGWGAESNYLMWEATVKAYLGMQLFSSSRWLKGLVAEVGYASWYINQKEQDSPASVSNPSADANFSIRQDAYIANVGLIF